MTGETELQANDKQSATVSPQLDNEHRLTAKETRQFVTPYAFEVAPELFGTPLASPTKRGVAMLIDLTLVALLTQVSSLLLAGIAAATFFRAGNRLKQKVRFNALRIFLRFLTALLLFVMVLGIFESINNDNDYSSTWADRQISIGQGAQNSDSSDINGLAALGLSAKYLMASIELKNTIKAAECIEPAQCWQELGQELVAELIELKIPQDAGLELLDVFVELSDDNLLASQRVTLKKELQSSFSEKIESQIRPQNATVGIPTPAQLSEPWTDTESSSSQESPSLLAWLKGLAEDLGLGFGWAAFYFSVFTAWWKGQTPGKRVTNIKVVRLDGLGLNLWESFGRYGGYGAGLATGLMGFMQVYWDPNRQAIQDKISETLVIDLNKTKVLFNPSLIDETKTT